MPSTNKSFGAGSGSSLSNLKRFLRRSSFHQQSSPFTPSGLPASTRFFRRLPGYRLLREYFAFRQRFLFFELASLQPLLRRCPGNELDLLVLFRDQDLRLENRIDANSIALFCSPAINLFERRLDRIPLDHRHHEYQVIPDKTRPFDFEVFET